MKISVIIPAYNSEATIRATLDSVLRQTAPPEEIMVMDDGSTDQTASILTSYEARVTVLHQRNGGVASARNALIARAQGDMISFLDSDDLWHPRYLEEQRKLFDQHPNAAAFFRAHEDFGGLGPYGWADDRVQDQGSVEVIAPVDFIERACVAPGPFVISFCSVPKRVVDGMGSEPFKSRIAEDTYFGYLLPFGGPLVFASTPLGAYRIREGSLSSNRLNLTEGEVGAFELIAELYERSTDVDLTRAFRKAFAVKRRQYAKVLLGAGKTQEAREQLRKSLNEGANPVSGAKSLALLVLSYLPGRLQPAWPSSNREWNKSGGK